MIIQMVIIKFFDSLKKVFSAKSEKLKIIILKLMEKIFVIHQLMTQLNNMMTAEKYQHAKMMIIQQILYYILLISKNYEINCF